MFCYSDLQLMLSPSCSKIVFPDPVHYPGRVISKRSRLERIAWLLAYVAIGEVCVSSWSWSTAAFRKPCYGVSRDLCRAYTNVVSRKEGFGKGQGCLPRCVWVILKSVPPVWLTVLSGSWRYKNEFEYLGHPLRVNVISKMASEEKCLHAKSRVEDLDIKESIR